MSARHVVAFLAVAVVVAVVFLAPGLIRGDDRPSAVRPTTAPVSVPVDGELAALGVYLESLPTTTTTTTTVPPPTVPPVPIVTGARSYDWWEAIATCESGNTNAWRTGYYGLEAGSPIGHLSKAEQLAWAERIYAEHGDSAWGCAPVAWSMVPSG